MCLGTCKIGKHIGKFAQGLAVSSEIQAFISMWLSAEFLHGQWGWE